MTWRPEKHQHRSIKAHKWIWQTVFFFFFPEKNVKENFKIIQWLPFKGFCACGETNGRAPFQCCFVFGVLPLFVQRMCFNAFQCSTWAVTFVPARSQHDSLQLWLMSPVECTGGLFSTQSLRPCMSFLGLYLCECVCVFFTQLSNQRVTIFFFFHSAMQVNTRSNKQQLFLSAGLYIKIIRISHEI